MTRQAGILSRKPLTFLSIASYFLFLCLFASAFAYPQSTQQLQYLFFDGYYLENEKGLRLSSGGNGQPTLDSTANALPEQERTPAQLLETVRRYESVISSIIESTGTYEPDLIQQYLSLGNAQQQAGEYEQAVIAFESAMHIQRVNEGLFTLNQVEVVNELIDGYERARNFPEADKYHEYLYYLLVQNLEPDDERLQAATIEYADWNLEAFKRMIFLGEEGLALSSNLQNGPAAMLRRGELIPIESNLSGEIQFVPRAAFQGAASMAPQMYRAEQLFDPRLKRAEDILDKFLDSRPNDLALLERKANIIQLFRTQLEEFVSSNVIGSNISASSNRLTRSVTALRRGYNENRDSFIAIAEAQENPETAAAAYLDVADWDLLFDRPQRATENYKKAWETLRGAGYSSERADNFLSPEPALFVPAYIAYKDTRQFQDIKGDLDIPYIGYIDVSFDKRKNGSITDISIESASENTGQRIKTRLLGLLRKVKIRPHVENGETQELKGIKVRYYYSY